MRYHSLQHVSFESPGLLVDFIRDRGDSLWTTALYRGEALPAVDDFDSLIIMGGPMSIHDEAEFPWLRSEKELIAAAIRNGKKVLGICLGAQLIASVCGARVYRNAVKEIGFWPVKWVAPASGEGRWNLEETTGGAPGGTRFFHWHGETFDLPDAAVLLASTEACVNQAFRIGDRVMGVQFHPEVTPAIIRGMIDQEGWELIPAPYIQTRDEILAEAARLAGGSGSVQSEHISFLTNWLCRIPAGSERSG